MMIVGLCEIELSIPESRSLKDKRQVLRSLLDTLRAKFNASVSEVGRQDSLQRATVGIAVVSNETKFTVQVIHKALDFIRSNPRVTIIDYTIETL